MKPLSQWVYAPSPSLARMGALVAVLFWGSSFVATKILLRELAPLDLVFARSALGSLVLTAIVVLRRRPLVAPRDAWGSLLLMGFVGVFLQQALQAQALTLTSAMNTGWLIGLIPLWTAILARFVLKERFGAQKSAGLAVGFLGALVLVSRGKFDPGVLALPGTRGDLLVLASTFNWAVYTVIGHRTLRRLGAIRATAASVTVGAILLLPVFLAGSGARDLLALSATGWAALVFLGVGCSGLGYLFWYGALERIEASRVASLLYLEPLVTFAAAALILAEPVRISTVAGGLLVIAGVLLVERAPAAPRPAGPGP